MVKIELTKSGGELRWDSVSAMTGYLLPNSGFSRVADVDDEGLPQRRGARGKEVGRRVRVLCLVMTFPKYHDKRAHHVKATWGKRCNTLHQFHRRTVVTYIHVGGPRLKADDDTYVIVENFRYSMYGYNTFGALLLRLSYTMKYEEENSETARCHEQVGAKAMDTRDQHILSLIGNITPATAILPKLRVWRTVLKWQSPSITSQRPKCTSWIIYVVSRTAIKALQYEFISDKACHGELALQYVEQRQLDIERQGPGEKTRSDWLPECIKYSGRGAVVKRNSAV
ncbi:hypothetical protein J6590_019695 [Homalodisca vitripennis]|nr:hypothetical protein J6590_019695 [Homalodisca vitripennis]